MTEIKLLPLRALGITKRELFTIAAMHTLRAGDYAKWEHLAQDAVSLADAILAAISQQPAPVGVANKLGVEIEIPEELR